MRIAAFTMVRDECDFLPIWLAYYGKIFGYDNLFVINHGSSDNSCDDLPCSVVNLPKTDLDEIKRASLVSNFNSSLLEIYDVVMYCDVDEIVVPDPHHFKDLKEFIQTNNADVIAGIGLALLHIRTLEESWTPREPILQQRRHVAFHSSHCKPTITRKPVRWKVGFHSIVGDYQIHIHLFMFHLKAMDYKLAHANLEKRRTVKFSENSIRQRHSVQFAYDNEKFDSTYFKFGEKDLENIRDQFNFDIDVQNLVNNGISPHNIFGSLGIIPERFRNLF